MDLTRYWRARYKGSDIEVQWTGFRFHGGWTLRLLVDGKLKAEQRVGRFARNFEVRDGQVTVNFWGMAFRHRCKISGGGTVLTDRAQAWNALAFTIISLPMVLAFLIVVISRRMG